MGFQFHRKLFHPYNGSIDAIIIEPCRTYYCSPIPSPLHSPISQSDAANPLLSFFPDGNHMDQKSYFLHVAMISIASTIGLVMVLYTMSKIIRYFCSRRHFISRRNPPILFDIRGGSRFSDDDDEGPAIGHHIWIIPTVGLQQSTIESIAAFKYRRDEGLIEGTECLICLGEFQEGESLRLLPKCSHSFHVPCIDTWLRSHNNCPMCRAPIVYDIGTSTGGGMELVRTTEHDSISSFSSGNEETQMENLGGGEESHHVGESQSSVTIASIVGDDNDSCVFCCEEDKNLTSSEKMNCDSSISIGYVSSARELQEEISQPMRGLVSVDSSCDSMMFHDAVDSNSDVESTDTNFDKKRVSSSKDFATIAKQGNESSSIHKVASFGDALQKRHFSLRRSSSRGRKFMFSRSCRSQSSTLTL